METPSLRDLLPLAAGLAATAVLSFTLGGLTTYWALQGSGGQTAGASLAASSPQVAPAGGSAPVASLAIPAAVPPEQLSASPPSFDPDALELGARHPERGESL